MRQNTICLLLLTFLILTGSNGHSQEIVAIKEEVDERIFSLQDLEYYEDKEGSLDFETISSAVFSDRFKRTPRYRIQDFNSSSTYWVRIRIRHNKDSEKIWLLEFYDQTIDDIVAYIPGKNGGYHVREMGDRFNFKKRTFDHKNFEIILDNSSNQVKTYYFKINSHNNADVRIALRSLHRFIYYALNEYLLFGLYYGMILIISLYNLLTYLAFRETKYIVYIFYLMSVAMLALSEDGIAFQYLWPGNPEWNQIAAGIALYSLILWALVFTKKFMHTSVKAPVLNKIIIGVIFARSLLFLFALYVNPVLFQYKVIDLVPVMLIFYTSIYLWFKDYRPSRFVVIAYGILFVGFTTKVMVNLGIIPHSIVAHYSLRISFLLEMLFLSVALGDKVRILKDNRDRAQQRIIRQLEINEKLKDKVNRELEQKVHERTLALDKKNALLEETNLKLRNQSREINQINSMLDLDNWKLKNNIKEALRYRLINKDLEYDEFQKIFPDKMACYRYLEEMKWSKGFTCRKCDNKKSFAGNKKFSKRCTRCGYNESITAFTLFHGIKFPLEKAFYITYVVLSNKNDATLEELSTKLLLRTNTVWHFKNKVKNFIKEKGNKKGKTNGNWQNIITSFESRIDSYRSSKLKI